MKQNYTSSAKELELRQVEAIVAVLGYVLADLSKMSPMTAYLIELARQNLIDELSCASDEAPSEQRPA